MTGRRAAAAGISALALAGCGGGEPVADPLTAWRAEILGASGAPGRELLPDLRRVARG